MIKLSCQRSTRYSSIGSSAQCGVLGFLETGHDSENILQLLCMAVRKEREGGRGAATSTQRNKGDYYNAMFAQVVMGWGANMRLRRFNCRVFYDCRDFSVAPADMK